MTDRPESNLGRCQISSRDMQLGNVLCPSARCEEGAILLGIVGSTGSVGYIMPEIVVDAEFVGQAHRGRAPEKRFRFAQPCIEGRCLHWTGARCEVIDRALKVKNDALPSDEIEKALPHCSIRIRCRWFAQEGPQACRVCPYVITDLWPEDANPSEADRKVAAS
jgi:hypothetical protein